jgi:hypothetical protein
LSVALSRDDDDGGGSLKVGDGEFDFGESTSRLSSAALELFELFEEDVEEELFSWAAFVGYFSKGITFFWI